MTTDKHKTRRTKTRRGGASKLKEINKQRTDRLTRAETNKHRKIQTVRFTHGQINTFTKLTIIAGIQITEE